MVSTLPKPQVISARSGLKKSGSYLPLEIHSIYSFCEGTLKLSELITLAKASHLPYLCLADTNGFFGLIRFIQACQAADVKALVACRLTQGACRVLLIAKSMRGYAHISKLITDKNLQKDFDLEKALATSRLTDFVVITSSLSILQNPYLDAYAEVNVLRPDFGQVVTWAKEANKKMVLLQPVYFKDAEDFKTHQVLRAIYHRKNIWDLKPEDYQSPRASFLSPEGVKRDIQERYAYLPEAIAATQEIAEKCYFPFQLGELYFPVKGDRSYEILREMCVANIPKRYGKLTPIVQTRLVHELDMIRKKGFCDYFLVVEDIVRNAGRFTCGRGSGAASIVSFLLFITHVDPIEHKLYFERFLNEYRADPPDIDVDFAWDEKDRITQYVFDTYGERCAMVSNHITFSIRSALHEVAKLFGVPEKEIMEKTRHISWYYDKAKDHFIDVNENKQKSDSESTWQEIIHHAVRLNGIPRHLGLHCGGTIVVPKPIGYYVPVQKSTKGFNSIQWEKDQAEDFGLVKIDLLGNRSLAVVRDTLNAVNANYGLTLKYEFLETLEDPKTKAAIKTGNTLGVFYVESPAMRQLQKKAQVGDYGHLVIHSSIIRPAANEFINEYLRRLHGEPWEPLVPEMRELLKETYGIMVYQEDISKVAVKLGGFHVGEGEELRKVISNARKEKRKLELKAKLFKNLALKGYGEDIALKLWEMIESFAGYSFCKPHSASYAQLSFKACYLKVHYPAEFMAAVVSNQGGFYCPSAYLAEARRLGIKVLKPDINLSERHFWGDRDRIVTGFMAIKHLSQQTIQAILQERTERGTFLGLQDFIKRTGVSLVDLKLLIKAGCFEQLEMAPRAKLLFLASRYVQSLELGALSSTGLETQVPTFAEDTLSEKMAMEIDCFGYILSQHPMLYYLKRFELGRRVLAKEIHRYAKRTIEVAGVLITTKTVQTVKSELMKFVTWEDETGLIECVLFPKVYEKYGKKLNHLSPYWIRGKVDVEFGVWILTVSEIEELK